MVEEELSVFTNRYWTVTESPVSPLCLPPLPPLHGDHTVNLSSCKTLHLWPPAAPDPRATINMSLCPASPTIPINKHKTAAVHSGRSQRSLLCVYVCMCVCVCVCVEGFEPAAGITSRRLEQVELRSCRVYHFYSDSYLLSRTRVRLHVAVITVLHLQLRSTPLIQTHTTLSYIKFTNTPNL